MKFPARILLGLLIASWLVASASALTPQQREVLFNHSTLIGDQEPASIAMYSVRLLRIEYHGPLINLRCSTGPTTQDWFPDSQGNLPQASILLWCPIGTITVPEWYDQSGTGNHVLQGTVASQPQFVLNAQGGRPGIFWSGATAGMGLTKTSPVNMQPTSVTVIATHIVASNAAANIYLGSTHNVATDTSGWEFWAAQGSASKWNWVTYDGANHGLIPTLGYTLNSPVVFAGRVNGTTSNAFINGTKDVTSQSVGNLTYPNPTSLAIGNHTNNGSTFNGYEFEHVIFGSALNDGQIVLFSSNSRAYYKF